MKIIFFGTPDFAVYSLDALIKSERHETLAAVTQPDRPRGRGNKVSFSPVKEAALAAGVPVLQPERVKSDVFYNKLKKYGADIFIVAAYGRVLPERLLTLPKYGAVNVHASLLPKYRGAAPIQRAIMNGEKKTGVTIIQMDKGIDTGDMILKKEIEITETDTGGSLHDKLALLGAESLLAALFLLEKGEARPEKQDDCAASHAPMLDKETGRVNWNGEPEKIIDQIRALCPSPGAYTFYKGGQIKIYSGAKTESPPGSPGEIFFTGGRLSVKANGGGVIINEMQKTGGKRMDSADFARGVRIAEGESFE